MKPFNLEKAKEGAPVITRDGHAVRLICFDCKRPNNILGLVTVDNYEKPIFYNINGSVGSEEHWFDLFMKVKKHTGWVNICKYDNNKPYPTVIYDTYEQAIKAASTLCIDTVQITWEE